MQIRRPCATLIGCLAIIIWSTTAVTTAKLTNIPTMEILSITFFICFLATLIKLAIHRQWQLIKQPLIVWIVGVFGIYGNDLTYIAALKNAPVAQADLINNLWPILIIILSTLLPREKFTWRHFFAGLMGFAGICILVTGKHGIFSFQTQYLSGYMLALLDAFIWSSYCILSRYFKQVPVEMIGMYCGVGALLSLGNHFEFEVTVIPSLAQIILLITMGLTTQGIAYYFWDIGIKKGNFKFLSILSYFIPLGSICLLILFSEVKPTIILIFAALLVIGGTIISGTKFRKLWFKIKNRYLIVSRKINNIIIKHKIQSALKSSEN